MLKIITLSLAMLVISAPAFAGSCPGKVKAIDAALASGTAKHAEEVKKMRDEGEALHKAGEHAASVKVLVEAMTLGHVK
tara:strand:- start:132 stop:368 length:237 start_codon:yes stop_codon:yes gene_type:complete